MAVNDPASASPPPGRPPIRHVLCTECGHEKAVVAATLFGLMMCFCPICEHVWDCATPTAT
jgi:hypothetical protein